MTYEIALVLVVLVLTMLLFVTDVLRVDVTAILVMVSLPWLGLVTPYQAFTGLSSNAVMAAIAVMILGHGLERSGVMDRVARPLIRLGRDSESRLVAIVSTAVGLVSAFIQNIGSAALFLPAVLRISKRSRMSASRILMPMGFAAILGGTLTMVASGPLIVLNDLLRQGGEPAFGLFTVTPLGVVLLATGVLYFWALGSYLLPASRGASRSVGTQQQLIDLWDLPDRVHQFVVPEDSPLIGVTVEESRLWSEYSLHLLAIIEKGDVLYAPWRHTRIAESQELALLGRDDDVERMARDNGLRRKQVERPFRELRTAGNTGFAEVIVPPHSNVIDRTLREIGFRKEYSLEPVILSSGREEQREDFSDHVLQAGDALVVHGPLSRIQDLGKGRDFVPLTHFNPERTQEATRPLLAGLCFLGALGLVLSGVTLSLGLFTGALAMILLDVVSVEEAYEAVDWRTVFLLAGLIPLGLAMEQTGAARYVAEWVFSGFAEESVFLLLLAVGSLTTLFSLFMSNVAATVLLVPLVMVLGRLSGQDPRGLALLVGICASNSFLLPTHPVNALLMSPGGYVNRDYFRAGSLLTVLFILVASGFIYLFYL